MILFTYMMPSVVVVMPLSLLLSRLGMLNAKPTLILLYLSLAMPFVIWVMQSYFGSLSRTYEEAASIEGCNLLQVQWHIYLPMARPGIRATAILSFLIAWDEFFFALVFTSTLTAKTIPVAIAEFSGKHYVDCEMIATGGVIASLPPALIDIVFQKYIVMGMTSGGIKELPPLPAGGRAASTPLIHKLANFFVRRQVPQCARPGRGDRSGGIGILRAPRRLV